MQQSDRKERHRRDRMTIQLIRICVGLGSAAIVLLALALTVGPVTGKKQQEAENGALETDSSLEPGESFEEPDGSTEEPEEETSETASEASEEMTEETIEETTTEEETTEPPVRIYTDLTGIQAGTVLDPIHLEMGDIGRYFTIHEIREGDEVYERIIGKSYRPNDNVALSDIRYMLLPHYNFDGEIQVGEIIVDASLAEEIRSIFIDLFYAGYQIEKMHLVDDYWTGDPDTTDTESIDHNNTSSFNYRAATGSSHLSMHAFGRAIDLNPQQNPYVSYSSGSPHWVHTNANDYIDRTTGLPHVITHEDTAYLIFKKYGYTWGGDWDTIKDYQHFEKRK